MRKLQSLCMLRDLPDRKPKLLREGKKRLACVRQGARVSVLEDRCPHEGHPLSMGTLRDGVLTCPWHNWKFDVETGECVFGGESVATYDVEVVHGEVFVDVTGNALDAEARLSRDLRRALVVGDVEGALRQALRIHGLNADERAPIVSFVEHLAEQGIRGAGDALLGIAASMELKAAGVLSHAEALAVMLAGMLSEPRAERVDELPTPKRATLGDRDVFLEHLLEERRSAALAVVRGLPIEVSFDEICHEWFFPYAHLKLWDRGLLLPRIQAARRLSDWLGPSVREALLVLTTRSLAWAVAESDLPAWRPTRQGLTAVARRAPMVANVNSRTKGILEPNLTSQKNAVEAVIRRFESGGKGEDLGLGLAHHALRQIRDFDLPMLERTGKGQGAYDVARSLVFAEECLRLGHDRFDAPRKVMLAGMVGHLANACRGSEDRALAVEPSEGAVVAAVRDLVVGSNLPWTTQGRGVVVAHACWRMARRAPQFLPAVMEALVRLRERDTGGDLPGMLRRVDRVLKGEGSARGMADKVSKPEDIQGGDRGRDQGRGGMG